MARNKVAIIGCGKQGEKHAKLLRAQGEAEVVFYDQEAELARSLAEAMGGEFAPRLDDLCRDPAVKAVVIGTPTPSHLELIATALRAGKYVFCEKPLAGDAREAAEIRKLEEESGRFVMVGYLYRFAPVFERCRELLQPGQDGEPPLGRPLSAFFRIGGRGSHRSWKHMKASGGGAVNEMLVHMVDLAGWLLGPLGGAEVLDCKLLSPTRLIGGEEVTVDAEDYILVRLNAQRGCEIICQADLITPAFTQYVEIQGDNGSFLGSIQEDMPSFVYLKEARGAFAAGKTPLRGGGPGPLQKQMETFVQAALKGRPLERNTSEDSLALMNIIDQIKGQCAL